MRTPLRSAVLAAVLCLLAAPAAAQSFWLDRESGELSLELLHPTPEFGDLTFFSFAAFATVAAEVGETALLVVELPFSRAAEDFEGAEGETALGNPYVGLRTIPTEATGVRWSAGVRIPLASDNAGVATATGLMSSASDRFEAFIPDLLAVDAAGRYVGALSDVAKASGRFGAVVDVPTGGGDVELFLQYGAKTWIESQGLSAGLGLSGRYIVSASDVAFADRMFNELGIWADYAFGSIRPGVRVQLPVGDLSNLVDRVIGVYVRYQFP